MKTFRPILCLLLLLQTAAFAKRIVPGIYPGSGANCQEKSQLMWSANKVLNYCMQAWQRFNQPTDPEPDSCKEKLKNYEQAVRTYRACVKKQAEEMKNSGGTGSMPVEPIGED